MHKPILDRAKFKFDSNTNFTQYPFSLPIIKNLQELVFHSQVTFLIGENGSGKSTILEAIAYNAGFGIEGGSKNINFASSDQATYIGTQNLANNLILSWRHKPTNHDGYFFRAESFFNIANYIDQIAKDDYRIYDYYGGKSLHFQSHGESFWTFFKNRMGQGGFFVLDEPEAALSPQRQLSFLLLIYKLCQNPYSQFIIASHSPILLAYPNATIYNCNSDILTKIDYTDTEHYQISKNFLNCPERYLNQLFEE